MKHRVFAAAVLGATVWLLGSPDTASAFGGRLLGGRDKGCAPAPSCGATVVPCGPAAPVPQVEQEVTVLEAKETKTKQKVKVLKPVEVEKEVTVKVPTQTTVKKEVTTFEYVKVEKPVEVLVNEWQPAKEEREVVSYAVVPKKVVVDVVTYVCQPKTITETVTVTHKVPVCVDPCAGFLARLCAPKYTCVTECKPVCRTVVERVPVHTKVEKVVNECVPTKIKQVVEVKKCVQVKKTVVHTSYECKPVKKAVDVVECVWVDKKEKVKVWECKEVEQEVDVVKVDFVPVKKKVLVPAPVPAPCGPVVGGYGPAAGCGSPCPTDCDGGKKKRKLFGGLFHRDHGCGATAGCGC